MFAHRRICGLPLGDGFRDEDVLRVVSPHLKSAIREMAMDESFPTHLTVNEVYLVRNKDYWVVAHSHG